MEELTPTLISLPLSTGQDSKKRDSRVGAFRMEGLTWKGSRMTSVRAEDTSVSKPLLQLHMLALGCAGSGLWDQQMLPCDDPTCFLKLPKNKLPTIDNFVNGT